MNDDLIHSLLEHLKDADAAVREQATVKLWRLWFHQKGAYGLEILEESQALLEQGKLDKAAILLTELIHDQPDFAEAWNRRAVVYYIQEQYRKSLADCEQVVALNVNHFGAWHGMGLCYAALGEYAHAIYAFRHALSLQPHSVLNQRLLLECTARLS